MRLYHFTCLDHGARWIEQDGEIKPRFHQVLGDTFAWFTPFASATARDLGLTRVRLTCNRMERRYEVDVDRAIALPWTGIRDQFPDYAVEMLESAPGAKPATWWLTRVPVPISHILVFLMMTPSIPTLDAAYIRIYTEIMIEIGRDFYYGGAKLELCAKHDGKKVVYQFADLETAHATHERLRREGAGYLPAAEDGQRWRWLSAPVVR